MNLIFLETSGITVTIDGINNQLFFSVVPIIGDNLGLHSIFGFSESFNCLVPCRFCLCSKTDCCKNVSQNNFKMRTEQTHVSNTVNRHVTTSGIKEECMWNKLSSFHVVYDYSVAIMHDVLEGVCNFDISQLLNVFVYKFKYFSLDT